MDAHKSSQLERLIVEIFESSALMQLSFRIAGLVNQLPSFASAVHVPCADDSVMWSEMLGLCLTSQSFAYHRCQVTPATIVAAHETGATRPQPGTIDSQLYQRHLSVALVC